MTSFNNGNHINIHQTVHVGTFKSEQRNYKTLHHENKMIQNYIIIFLSGIYYSSSVSLQPYINKADYNEVFRARKYKFLQYQMLFKGLDFRTREEQGTRATSHLKLMIASKLTTHHTRSRRKGAAIE